MDINNIKMFYHVVTTSTNALRGYSEIYKPTKRSICPYSVQRYKKHYKYH